MKAWGLKLKASSKNLPPGVTPNYRFMKQGSGRRCLKQEFKEEVLKTYRQRGEFTVLKDPASYGFASYTYHLESDVIRWIEQQQDIYEVP